MFLMMIIFIINNSFLIVFQIKLIHNDYYPENFNSTNLDFNNYLYNNKKLLTKVNLKIVILYYIEFPDLDLVK